MHRMLNLLKKASCTGCSSCKTACPRGCIQMNRDGEGFWYPEIDGTRCIDCGRCEKACPVYYAPPQYEGSTAYAAKGIEEAVRAESSSGGIFTLLAEGILQRGGVVFGVQMDDKRRAMHSAVEEGDALKRLRGSKYIQSDVGDTYAQAESYLKQGRSVLYSGTPCQIAGLRAYLGKDYDHLFCQDIICHGVPSPAVFEAYVDNLETKRGKIKEIQFRDKSAGWRGYCVRCLFSSGKVYKRRASDDAFMNGYLKNLFLRPSCHECHFKGYSRYGDITLADCWGAEKTVPELDDDRGVSLVLINSPKGKMLFQEICINANFRKVSREECLEDNRSALYATPANPQREHFFNVAEEQGFGAALRRFCYVAPYKRAYCAIKRSVKSALGHKKIMIRK